jgi:glycosyltransferase involved in cell wall biosynthesis
MMNVGIDITPIIYGRGVSRYTANLAQSLNNRKSINLSALGYSWRNKAKLEKFVKDNNISSSSLHSTPPSMVELLWKLGKNPVKKNLPQIDLFHSWDWLQPPDKNLPLVSTIHDVAMIRYPQTAHPRILAAHKRSWKILKEREAQIIAVSRTTKNDIVKLLGIPSYLIHVVHEALPAEFKQTSQQLTEDESEWIKNKLQLNKPYLLFVGTREPRKNLTRLIEAWKPLSKDYQLIVAGEKGWDKTEGIHHPQLRFLGHVEDKELAVLYGEAEIFCYPSLYEGFGLPILESFFHGTPVLTSNVSSMPEVAGNAAELINPESVDDIRKGLERILNESMDEQRKRLQRMIIRLQMFSWERVVDETIQVYKKALQSN